MKDLINHQDATIVDVRTVEEFSMGAADKSINIPMDQVTSRLDEFKGMSKPLILCCASGNRSGQVARYLLSEGMEDVYNGGGWADVQDLLDN